MLILLCQTRWHCQIECAVLGVSPRRDRKAERNAGRITRRQRNMQRTLLCHAAIKRRFEISDVPFARSAPFACWNEPKRVWRGRYPNNTSNCSNDKDEQQYHHRINRNGRRLCVFSLAERSPVAQARRWSKHTDTSKQTKCASVFGPRSDRLMRGAGPRSVKATACKISTMTRNPISRTAANMASTRARLFCRYGNNPLLRRKL